MTKARKSIDISDSPDLLRLAEEVTRSGEPCVLSKGKKQLAVLMPAKVIAPAPGRNRRQKTYSEEDDKAFLSSAGGWKGLVDTDALKAAIRESRGISSRQPRYL